MEIMNYSKMLENAQAVKVLANKTIECSKDYTDIKKDDVLEQIAEYIFNTVNDILHDPICHDKTFSDRASQNPVLSFGKYVGDGKGANVQFFFSREGTHLRLYINAISYWWADKIISDNGLKALIRNWPEYKKLMTISIKDGINAHNHKLQNNLSRQLELHDAIKNFQV
jgi:hypothetical protein